MIWRRPAEATEEYPGLHVHDSTVSGSIRCGGRLPLWAFATTAIHQGWETAEYGWMPTEHYGYTADDFAGFVHDLLEARGEFARLVCVIADVEREAQERDDQEWDRHFAEAHSGETVCECGHRWPGPWWDHDDLRARMAAQLRACLHLIDSPSPSGAGAPSTSVSPSSRTRRSTT